jgi:geranylgeranyl pyrophosphate synthase
MRNTRSLNSAQVNELALVEQLLADASCAAGCLGQSARYVLERPGKRIRARLALGLAASLHLPPEHSITLATAVELLHNASLVLDDVQDQDDMRSGQASAWRTFGRGQAINVGTFLIGQAFSLAARLPGVSPLFAAALREATIGQAAEIDFESSTPTLSDYEKMAEAKTGALFALAARAATVLAGLPDEISSSAARSFTRFGAAYQIHDDLADAFNLKGRSRAGLDLREGKTNAILLFHLSLRPNDSTQLHTFLRDKAARDDDEELDVWLGQLFVSGAVAATQHHLLDLCDEMNRSAAKLAAPMAPHLASLSAGICESSILERVRRSTSVGDYL